MIHMKGKILQAVDEGIEAVCQLRGAEGLLFIQRAAEMIAFTFRQKRKVLLAGNGGSLCDAAHFAEELTGFFRKKRPALAAFALTDPGYLTCVGNDLGFEHIFSRGVEAFGEEGDLFIGLTTSGNSLNIVRAFECAQERGLKTIAFLGKGGGRLKGVADLELVIDGFSTSDRIQEAHMTAIHIIIEMVEEILFYGVEQEVLEEVLNL